MKILFTTYLVLILSYSINAQVIFEDNFNSGNFSPEWTLNPNIQGTDGVIDIQNIGLDGTGGVRLGRANDGNQLTTNALDLQLDLSNEQDILLSFWIQSNDDNNHPEDGLYFSDGGAFVKVLDFIPQSWCGNTFGEFPPIDLVSLASEFGLNPFVQSFVIRFQQRGEDDFSGITSADGLYLDDIVVSSSPVQYQVPPFEENFNSGVFPSWISGEFANASILNQTETGLVSPSGVIDIQNGVGVDGTSGVRLGRQCDGPESVNGLDLYLDLSQSPGLEYLLDFDMSSNRDETDPDDGLYISDDAGENFIKVVDFQPELLCPNLYGKYPPINLTKLAESNQLNAESNTFVVRFQQRGEDDFSGITSSDGLYFDNISVVERNEVFRTPPFFDDFNSGVFPDGWSIEFADATITNQTEEGLVSPHGVVEIVNGIGLNNTSAIRMGRRCDNFSTVNALDLRLNLDNSETYQLSFSMLNNKDESEADDGLYLSVDNGENFTKITDFVFQTSSVYEEFEFNLSELANSAQLSLTDQTIIRFQQRGEDDFSGITSADGFYIDDLEVTFTTSINSIVPKIDVIISPNPTNQFVNVDLTKLKREVQFISLYDLSGRQLFQESDISENFLNGFLNIELPQEQAIYLLKIRFRDGTILTKRLVKH